METTKLEVLKEIVRIGSLRKAAEKLGYTQPALTSMMNSLESEFGFPLIKRGRSGVSYTSEGRALESYIQNVIAAEKDLRKKAREFAPSQTLHIGAYETIAVFWLPQIIRTFKEKYINIDITIEIGSAIQRDWLNAGTIDFGITDNVNGAGFEWIPLKKDIIYAAVHTSAPFATKASITLDELLQYPFLFPSGNANSATRRALKGKEILNRIEVSTHNANTLLLMVSQGLGSALISGQYMFSLPSSVQMVPLDPPIVKEVGVAVKSIENLSPLATEFIEELKKFTAESF